MLDHQSLSGFHSIPQPEPQLRPGPELAMLNIVWHPMQFPPIPTPKSILRNITPFSVLALALASSSKTGSIILHGSQEVDVKKATNARCVRKTEWNEHGFMLSWIGDFKICVVGVGAGVDGDVGAGMGRYGWAPSDIAREATAWSSVDARSVFEDGDAPEGAAGKVPAPGAGMARLLGISTN